MKRTKRTARPPVTRERALETAVAIADASGIEAVTMRRLAQELGVEAMSLYHHVANKDAVLDGMVDIVFEQVQLPAPDGPDWRQAMRDRAVSMREVMLRHPWSLAIMESRTSPGPATLRHHDAIIGCLRGANFPIPMAAHATSVLDAYIFGFVLTEVNLPFDDATSPSEMEQMVEGMLASFPADDYPHLLEMSAEYILQPDYSYAAEFLYGLDLILDGLEARVHALPGIVSE